MVLHYALQHTNLLVNGLFIALMAALLYLTILVYSFTFSCSFQSILLIRK